MKILVLERYLKSHGKILEKSLNSKLLERRVPDNNLGCP